MSRAPEVVIVGAGLAGLSAAHRLRAAGVAFRLLEASDGVGGRVRTDSVDGFLLDRGFQVLLTAYPEAHRALDLQALRLRSFFPGSLIRRGGRFHRFADPWRRPVQGLGSLLAGVGTLRDKLSLARLRRRAMSGSLDAVLARPERTTQEVLEEAAFSAEMIDGFFRPFLGGIFLDRTLRTSSRMFDFVFRMFAQGDAALPTGGMGTVTAQMAAALPAGTVRLGARVVAIDAGSVRLGDGENLSPRAVLVATGAGEADRLLEGLRTPPSCGTVCLYYDAPQPPVRQPILVLNGDGDGPVNNLCVPSQVARSYAPPGRALVSVSVVGVPDQDDTALETAVRRQLRDWFGPPVDQWRSLRIYRIAEALPAQDPPALRSMQRPVRLAAGLYVCGDHRDNASLNGALVSGRRAAEAWLAERG